MQKFSIPFSIEQFRNVKETLRQRTIGNSFTSHDFIGEYIKRYEYDYIGKLIEYRTPSDNRAFQTVNSEIARFLSENKDELHIRKLGKVKDTNVHHTETDNEEWIFTD